MAEKNTESTAVNQLIELVATAKPLPPDPDEDLMFKPVTKVSGPRMSTTIPPIAGAGEVAPLPRGRAPAGTQQGLQTIRAVPPAVRMTTQPPQRAITIPPLNDYDEDAELTNPEPSTLARPTTVGFAAAAPPPPMPAAYSRPTTPAPIARASGSHAAQRPSAPPPPPPAAMRESGDSIAARVTRPTLPPPVPTMRASSPPPSPALTIRASSPPPSPALTIRASSPPPAPASRATAPAFAAPEAPLTLDDAPAFRHSGPATRDFHYPVAHPSMMPVTLPPDDEDGALASILEPKVDAAEAGASWLEHDIGTQEVPKQSWQTIAGKLIAPMVILVIAGIFIGGYFAFDGDGGKKRKAKASEGQKITMPVTSDVAVQAPAEPAKVEAPAEPAKVVEAAKTEPAKTEPAKIEPPVTPPNLATATAPAKNEQINPAKTEPAKTEPAKTEPVPVPVAPSNARPTLVDIRIDSNPAGATVMLIDRGKQTFLGTTPMSAAVDVARKYELVFSYEGRATVVEALDPNVQKKLSVKLSRTKGSAIAPAIVAPKPAVAVAVAKPAAVDKPAVDKPATVAKPAVDKPAVDKPAVEKPAVEKPAVEKPKAAAQTGGEGVLMISSKPPCEIMIDGKSTGLTTPQRAIPLPAGAHKITLVNATEGIKKTLSVQITADKPTKVIQDFMK